MLTTCLAPVILRVGDDGVATSMHNNIFFMSLHEEKLNGWLRCEMLISLNECSETLTWFHVDCMNCSTNVMTSEECDDGEEIGTLACGHWYHPVCIQYWLRHKNWCPICKAPTSVDIN
ncbi:hypothetical protein KSP40_PGU004596 [Platanthera guangdongensis]|uniref:RING-type E3 ubiquitin transferase n=1 Tax=Platanthera guangdongensis TaxID=2320717 RepID=A0ABR2N5F8_9ASPA